MTWETKKSAKETYVGGKRYRFRKFAFWPRQTKEGYTVWLGWVDKEMQRFDDNSGWWRTDITVYAPTWHLTKEDYAKWGLKW